jgi:TetR/AcrR family transcriptional regulator
MTPVRTDLRAPSNAPALPAISHLPKGADATREKLLQAAHELLISRSGAEPSVSQICEHAGVQVAMVSYCFGGKNQLLAALIQRITDAVDAEFRKLVAVDLPPEEKLRLHVAAMVRSFARYPYLTELNERLPSGHRPADQMAGALVQPFTSFYRELFREGSRRDRWREPDAALFFFSIVGMCEYLFAHPSLLSASGEELGDELIERFIDHTTDLLLHGIVVGPPGPANRPDKPAGRADV